jgi:hypothetical protein
MRKPLVLLVLALALFPALPATPAEAASPPTAVTFEINTTLGDPSGGPFVATGPAVEAGIICSHGDTVDLDLNVAGNEAKGHVNFQVFKKFTCADTEADSFVGKLQVRVGDKYSWLIVEGTGAYARLRGTGMGEGTFVEGQPYTLLDVLQGAVHVD